MKISICIPQYNRIGCLLKSLHQIKEQTYHDIEIVVSDDCSTDDTQEKIAQLSSTYKYPVVYKRNPVNYGYDRNYRQCIELASGEYCFVIGNDDTIYRPDSIQFLVDFLKTSGYPELGFCNYVEENNPNKIIERAHQTTILGSGKMVALKYYSCFSFVGGLIYKKSAFERHNTAKHDGSIYAQMYLGCVMISAGERLFSIKEPLVLKDLNIDGRRSNNYRDQIARTWKDYKIVDGGLPSVINVLISAFRDAKVLDQYIIRLIFSRIYRLTYPHWILDYRSNNAFPEAVGLIVGLNPVRNSNFKLLNYLNRIVVFSNYLFSTIVGLLTPVYLFNKLKHKLYTFFKK